MRDVTTATGPLSMAGDDVAAVRRFNRFYTRRIGVLDRGHLHTAFSLAEVRVIYEIAHWLDGHDEPPTATDIARALGLDPGYLSRMLHKLERRRLIARTTSPSDGRQQHLQLTDKGHATFLELDERARADVAALLDELDHGSRRDVVDAMSTIARALESPGASHRVDGTGGVVLRPPKAGDLGWVVASHGALYMAEYGWDWRFEGLVAKIVADFVEHFDARKDRCWIAERSGENVGSIFLVRHADRPGVARLRLLLVDPSARGLGLGRRLVDECTTFARQAGYHTITLWTNNVLTSARRIYEAAGYQLVDAKPHQGFGPDLVGETWELSLQDSPIIPARDVRT